MTANNTASRPAGASASNAGDERVLIFDTTLRDGEQSPGASMTGDEKLRLALLLEELGVDIIEAGFPVASSGDFRAVSAIAAAMKKTVVCALARAARGDILRAGEALQGASRPRIHTFISTSRLHMKHKLNMSADEVHQAVVDSVTLARSLTDDVEWSPEDGSRSEHDFLCRCVESAIQAGAGTINIPDTVGYTLPEEFAALFTMLRNRVPNIDKAVLSAHCHNDLGMAVANALAAVRAGARQVECTINGIGERAGNAALEEIVMALRTRRDQLPYRVAVDSTILTRASRMVSSITGFVVQPNKAIVGQNAFAHEAGIHQDGVLKNAQTYEIMTPESVGLKDSTLVLGKHSGRRAFRAKLEELGYDSLTDSQLDKAFARFKDLADHKKEIFEEDIIALADDEAVRSRGRLALDNVRLLEAGDDEYHVEVTLEIDGLKRSARARASGIMDAVFAAIGQAFEHQARLQLYQVKAVTRGADAQAEVLVRLQDHDGAAANGQSASMDTLTASASAYVNALDRLLRQKRKAPTGAPRTIRFGGV